MRNLYPFYKNAAGIFLLRLPSGSLSSSARALGTGTKTPQPSGAETAPKSREQEQLQSREHVHTVPRCSACGSLSSSARAVRAGLSLPAGWPASEASACGADAPETDASAAESYRKLREQFPNPGSRFSLPIGRRLKHRLAALPHRKPALEQPGAEGSLRK